MIKKIETVFVRVSDISAAKKWYKKVLSKNIKWEMDKIVAFELGDTDLTLVEQEQEDLKDVTYNLLADNLETLRRNFIELGVKVSSIKYWKNIKYFTAWDPDSNKFEVIEKKCV